jgi:hypothetical protein
MLNLILVALGLFLYAEARYWAGKRAGRSRGDREGYLRGVADQNRYWGNIVHNHTRAIVASLNRRR